MRDGPDQIAGPEVWSTADAVFAGRAVRWHTDLDDVQAPPESVLRELQRIAKVIAAHERRQRAPDAAEPRPAAAGEIWGPLVIQEKIGAGAFGDVYRAHEPRLDREVALKFFRPHRLSASQMTSDVIEEGRLLARVRHPNVVTVHGAEHLDGRFGIWMELVDGSTLEDIVQEQGPLSAAEVLSIGQDLCRALTALHDAGVIHRDIKARNVIREDTGRIVLMDLGVSCQIDHQVPIDHYGTPLYAAPEVLLTNAATCQTDIYSVGVLLFHLFTGTYPVAGTTLAEVREAHEAGRYRSLRDQAPGVADAFLEIVETALAPDPAKRFRTAAAFEEALGRALAVEARPAQVATSLGIVRADGSVVRPRAEAYPRDQQAYNRYLQGLYFFSRRYRGIDFVGKAMDCFRQATDRDPGFALAHVGIADCLNIQSYYQYTAPKVGFPRARASLQRALALDPDLGEAQASLGYLAMFFDWDFPAAEEHFQRAIALKPQYVLARHWYAMFLSSRGRHDEALTVIGNCRELDPSALITNLESIILMQAGHLEEAVASFQMTLEADPVSLMHLSNLGLALSFLGRVEEAVATLVKAVEASRDEDSLAMGSLAYVLAVARREDEAIAVIERMNALAERRYVSHVHRAMPWLALDRRDRWEPLFFKAIEDRDSFLIWLRSWPGREILLAVPQVAERLRAFDLLD